MYSFHHHRRCWPTFIQYLPTMYLVQRMWAHPPNSGSMSVQHCSPLLVQCRSIVYDADPTLIYNRYIVYFAQTRGIQPMLFQCCPTVFDAGPSLKQHWVIVSCFLTAALCWWCFNIPAPGTPDNTIHCTNADVMLGHRLRRCAKIISTKTL